MPTTTHPYLVTLARDHTLKVHRSTCKKALANTAATATDQFETTLGDKTTTPATCCNPKPPKTSHEQTPPPAAPEPPAATYDPHPGRRGELATEEAKAKRAARRAGQPLPATPNLDKVEQEYADGIDAAKRRELVAEYENRHGTGKRRPKLDVRVRFTRGTDPEQLEPMPDSQNKLASVAYYHTRNIVDGAPRISTDALRKILADAGVPEPEAAPWGPVTLANGVVLAAVAL